MLCGIMCIYWCSHLWKYKLTCEIDQAHHFTNEEMTQSTSTVARLLGASHKTGIHDLFDYYTHPTLLKR